MTFVLKSFVVCPFVLSYQSSAAVPLCSGAISWGSVPEVTPLASTTVAYVALGSTSNCLLTELLIKKTSLQWQTARMPDSQL